MELSFFAHCWLNAVVAAVVVVSVELSRCKQALGSVTAHPIIHMTSSRMPACVAHTSRQAYATSESTLLSHNAIFSLAALVQQS